MKKLLVALIAGAVFLSACSSDKEPTSFANGHHHHHHHKHHKNASGSNNLK
jgi:major membrane immunogen (membrane-anchored lipoprotein)